MPLASMSKVIDLRHAARCGRNSGELELRWSVVHRHLPLALEHVNLHRGLVVFRG
jgi:hypothetical protein